MKLTKKQWQKELGSQQYKILRGAQTERPFSGRLLDCQQVGTYLCGACSQALFKSSHKFNSKSGWPSFYRSRAKALLEKPDGSLGVVRTEVICSRCRSHLGHVFSDAPQTPTGRRYCINSGALKFKNEKGEIQNG